MKIETAKKYGFFSALAMVIGSAVGIGIFIKNQSIFEMTQGNSIAILLSWILGGIIALMSAISFSEITKSNVSTNGGLGQYAETYVGKRFSYFIRTTYPLVYYSILQLALGFFTYNFFTDAFGVPFEITGIGIVIFIGVPISLLFNVYFPRTGKRIMNISLIIKFIPLIFTSLIGVWYTSNNGGIGQTMTIEKSSEVENIGTFSALLIALPSVLFAFDAFVGIGSIAKDTKNAEKTIPLAIGIGISIVTLIYILITITQINHNSGIISETISIILKTEILTKIIKIIIVISAIGTYTAITTCFLKSTQSAIDENFLPFSNKMKKKLGDKACAYFCIFWSFLFSIPIFLIYALTNNEINYFDEMSNMPTLFFMIFYSVIFIGFIFKKIKNKEKGNKKYYLIAIGSLAALSIISIVLFQFYILIKELIEVLEGSNNSLLEAKLEQEVIKRLPIIIFPILLYLIPIILLFIKHKFENKKSFKESFKNAILFKF